jgi:hypothetical protein
VDRGLAGLDERAPGAVGREIARLRPEAHQGPAVGPVEDRVHPEPGHLGGLRLLDPVAGDVRGVVEPGQERAVQRREDLHLAHPGLDGEACEGLPDRAPEIHAIRPRR